MVKFTKYVHAMFLYMQYVHLTEFLPQHLTEIFSFIDRSQSFNSRQINRQISTEAANGDVL